MTLRTLTTADILYFIMCKDPHEQKFIKNKIWFRAQSHMTSHYTWGSVTTLHDFGGVLGRPLDTFFWALTISWSWLLACVWSGPLAANVVTREFRVRCSWEDHTKPFGHVRDANFQRWSNLSYSISFGWFWYSVAWFTGFAFWSQRFEHLAQGYSVAEEDRTNREYSNSFPKDFKEEVFWG